MSYHAGTCYWPEHFDYSPENIATIPVGTIRKYGHTAWDTRFFYVEGDRVRAFQAAGKRVLGTFDVAGKALDKWATMPDEKWAELVTQYCEEIPVRGVEVGNEVGGPQANDYLPKLAIASEIIRRHKGWVMLSSPFPGGETKVWDAVQRAGAWGLVDGVACHPYARDPAASLVKVQGFRTQLKLYGGPAARLGLHLTEWGWPTDAGGTKNPYVVTEAVQAQYIAQAFRLWQANAAGLRVNNVLLYTYNDGMDGPAYGVVREDGTHKPGYASLEAAA